MITCAVISLADMFRRLATLAVMTEGASDCTTYLAAYADCVATLFRNEDCLDFFAVTQTEKIAASAIGRLEDISDLYISYTADRSQAFTKSSTQFGNR